MAYNSYTLRTPNFNKPTLPTLGSLPQAPSLPTLPTLPKLPTIEKPLVKADSANPNQVNSITDIISKTIDPAENNGNMFRTAIEATKEYSSHYKADRISAFLTGAGEDVDILANIVKAMYPTSMTTGKLYNNLDQSTVGKRVQAALGVGVKGRYTYDMDTGNKLADFALEVVSDPLTILELGGKAVTGGLKAAGKSAAKEVVTDNKAITKGLSGLASNEKFFQLFKDFTEYGDDLFLKSSVANNLKEELFLRNVHTTADITGKTIAAVAEKANLEKYILDMLKGVQGRAVGKVNINVLSNILKVANAADKVDDAILVFAGMNHFVSPLVLGFKGLKKLGVSSTFIKAFNNATNTLVKPYILENKVINTVTAKEIRESLSQTSKYYADLLAEKGTLKQANEFRELSQIALNDGLDIAILRHNVDTITNIVAEFPEDINYNNIPELLGKLDSALSEMFDDYTIAKRTPEQLDEMLTTCINNFKASKVNVNPDFADDVDQALAQLENIKTINVKLNGIALTKTYTEDLQEIKIIKESIEKYTKGELSIYDILSDSSALDDLIVKLSDKNYITSRLKGKVSGKEAEILAEDLKKYSTVLKRYSDYLDSVFDSVSTESKLYNILSDIFKAYPRVSEAPKTKAAILRKAERDTAILNALLDYQYRISVIFLGESKAIRDNSLSYLKSTLADAKYLSPADLASASPVDIAKKIISNPNAKLDKYLVMPDIDKIKKLKAVGIDESLKSLKNTLLNIADIMISVETNIDLQLDKINGIRKAKAVLNNQSAEVMNVILNNTTEHLFSEDFIDQGITDALKFVLRPDGLPEKDLSKYLDILDLDRYIEENALSELEDLEDLAFYIGNKANELSLDITYSDINQALTRAANEVMRQCKAKNDLIETGKYLVQFHTSKLDAASKMFETGEHIRYFEKLFEGPEGDQFRIAIENLDEAYPDKNIKRFFSDLKNAYEYIKLEKDFRNRVRISLPTDKASDTFLDVFENYRKNSEFTLAEDYTATSIIDKMDTRGITYSSKKASLDTFRNVLFDVSNPENKSYRSAIESYYKKRWGTSFNFYNRLESLINSCGVGHTDPGSDVRTTKLYIIATNPELANRLDYLAEHGDVPVLFDTETVYANFDNVMTTRAIDGMVNQFGMMKWTDDVADTVRYVTETSDFDSVVPGFTNVINKATREDFWKSINDYFEDVDTIVGVNSKKFDAPFLNKSLSYFDDGQDCSNLMVILDGIDPYKTHIDALLEFKKVNDIFYVDEEMEHTIRDLLKDYSKNVAAARARYYSLYDISNITSKCSTLLSDLFSRHVNLDDYKHISSNDVVTTEAKEVYTNITHQLERLSEILKDNTRVSAGAKEDFEIFSDIFGSNAFENKFKDIDFKNIPLGQSALEMSNDIVRDLLRKSALSYEQQERLFIQITGNGTEIISNLQQFLKKLDANLGYKNITNPSLIGQFFKDVPDHMRYADYSKMHNAAKRMNRIIQERLKDMSNVYKIAKLFDYFHDYDSLKSEVTAIVNAFNNVSWLKYIDLDNFKTDAQLFGLWYAIVSDRSLMHHINLFFHTGTFPKEALQFRELKEFTNLKSKVKTYIDKAAFGYFNVTLSYIRDLNNEGYQAILSQILGTRELRFNKAFIAADTYEKSKMFASLLDSSNSAGTFWLNPKMFVSSALKRPAANIAELMTNRSQIDLQIALSESIHNQFRRYTENLAFTYFKSGLDDGTEILQRLLYGGPQLVLSTSAKSTGFIQEDVYAAAANSFLNEDVFKKLKSYGLTVEYNPYMKAVGIGIDQKATIKRISVDGVFDHYEINGRAIPKPETSIYQLNTNSVKDVLKPYMNDLQSMINDIGLDSGTSGLERLGGAHDYASIFEETENFQRPFSKEYYDSLKSSKELSDVGYFLEPKLSAMTAWYSADPSTPEILNIVKNYTHYINSMNNLTLMTRMLSNPDPFLTAHAKEGLFTNADWRDVKKVVDDGYLVPVQLVQDSFKRNELGYYARLVPIDNAEDFKYISTPENNVFFVPYNVYSSIVSTINNAEKGYLQSVTFKPAMYALLSYKIGYIGANPGSWFRNFIDSNLKAIVDSGDAFGHARNLISARKYNMEYEDVLSKIITYSGTNTLPSETVFKETFRELINNGAFNNVINKSYAGNAEDFYDMMLFLRNFSKSGVSGGMTRMDIQDSLGYYAKRTKAGSALSKITDLSMRPMSWIEDDARLAQYLTLVDNGVLKAQAISRISHTAFDYNIKTRFGRMLEYIIPFYTFQKNNFAYWVKEICDKPYLLKTLLDFYNVSESSFGTVSQEEFLNNEGLKYHINNGNINVSDAGLILKINPSYLDALNVLIDPTQRVLESMLAPVRNFISPKEAEGVFASNLFASKEHAPELWKRTSSMFSDLSSYPILGTLYQNYLAQDDPNTKINEGSTSAKNYDRLTKAGAPVQAVIASMLPTVFGSVKRWTDYSRDMNYFNNKRYYSTYARTQYTNTTRHYNYYAGSTYARMYMPKHSRAYWYAMKQLRSFGKYRGLVQY